MSKVYALGVESSCQYESAILSFDDLDTDTIREDTVLEETSYHWVEPGIEAQVISQICRRPINFKRLNIRRNGTSFYGWWISEWEWIRIVELTELYSAHRRYLELCKLPA